MWFAQVIINKIKYFLNKLLKRNKCIDRIKMTYRFKYKIFIFYIYSFEYIK